MKRLFILLFFIVFFTLSACTTTVDVDPPLDETPNGIIDDDNDIPGDNNDDPGDNGDDPIDDDNDVPGDDNGDDPIDDDNDVPGDENGDDPIDDDNDTPSDDNGDDVSGNISESLQAALTMISGIMSVFPEQLVLSNIGQHNTDFTVGTAGNRYMDNGETIYEQDMNLVTSDLYLELFTRYNASTSHFLTYVSPFLPVLTMIQSFDTDYTFSGGFIRISQDENENYEILGEATLSGQIVTVSIFIDSLNITNSYTTKFHLSHPNFDIYYEITRSLTKLESISSITRTKVSDYDAIYAMTIDYTQSDEKIISLFKHEVAVNRKYMYITSNTHTTLHYKNEDTGTEIVQYLDENGILLFEYEDYMPNVPLAGTAKTRWFLHNSSGFESILYTTRTLQSNYYTFINEHTLNYSNTMRIEAKSYFTRIYDDVNDEYIRESTTAWAYRRNVSWDDTDLFETDFPFAFNDKALISLEAVRVYNLAQTIKVLDYNLQTVAKEDIVQYLE